MRFVADTIRVDKQGRILIPKEMRQKMGIEKDSEVKAQIIGKKLILEPTNENLEKIIQEWESKLISFEIKAFNIPERDGNNHVKWFSEEYVHKKLGL